MVMMLAASFTSVYADDYEDDIYYNPKKSEKKVKKQSAYDPNFSNQDVDSYNLRGQYYTTPIDTIGATTSAGEDFVYTQEIQKYYNPTIVVDNADVLGDILDNSYGNVEVVYNINGVPSFSPIYYYPYSGWNISWNLWGPSVTIGWNNPFWGPSWSWGPSWAWGPSWSWGPSWAWGPSWGPSWSWGWGPAWGPSWGCGPCWRPGYAHHDYRPGGRVPVAPGGGWAHNTRPGNSGNHYGYGYNGNRPGGSGHHNYGRPGSSVNTGGNNAGSGSNGNRLNGYLNNRGQGTGNHNTVTTRPSNSGGGGYRVDSDGHRRSNSSSSGSGYNSNRGSSSKGSGYNSNRGSSNSNSNSNRSYKSNSNSNRSYNSTRSSGGSYRSSGGGYRGGGGSRGGGGARGSHR